MDSGAQGGQAGMGPHHPATLLGLGKGFCCCRCLAQCPWSSSPSPLAAPLVLPCSLTVPVSQGACPSPLHTLSLEAQHHSLHTLWAVKTYSFAVCQHRSVT